MVAYPILLEGQTRSQLKQEAGRYVLGLSSHDSQLQPLLSEFDGKPTDEALRELGGRYQAARKRGTSIQQNVLMQAMGYYQLVRDLTNAQAANQLQFSVESWRDLNIAARDRAIELANAPVTDIQRAAQLVISDNPTYRNRVAAALDGFLRAHAGQSEARIDTALQRRIYDNRGTGQYILEGVTSSVTNWTLSNDMRRVYQALKTGQAPAPEAGGDLLASPANAATPPVGAPANQQSRVNRAAITAALAEITGKEPGDKGMMNPTRTDHDVLADKVRVIVNRHAAILSAPQAKRDELYATLLNTYKTAPNVQDRLAAGYALDVIVRAFELAKAQSNGREILTFANRDAYLAWSRDNEVYAADPIAWRRAHGGTVASSVGDGSGTGGAGSGNGGEAAGNGAITSTGVRVYGRKDGTPPPNPAEVPNLKDEAQVRELQAKLGVTVDGMYGPETHAAMKAAAEKQNKQPKEFNFTLQDIWDKFVEWLTGASAGTGQTTGGAGRTTDAGAPPDLKTQLAAQLAAVASISDAVVDYRKQGVITVSDATVLSGFLDKFKNEQGVSSLTPEQIRTISVQNGVISSTLIGQVETALGLTVDNKMDARLEAALNNATVKSAVVAAFTGTAVSGGSTTEVASAGGQGAGGSAPAR